MSRRTVSVDVIRIPTAGPGDVSGLIALIEAGKIIPGDILAVLGKTEGNGGVNDFTREYAVAALREGAGAASQARAAGGRRAHRLRDVGRHRGRAQPPPHRVCAQLRPQPTLSRREN